MENRNQMTMSTAVTKGAPDSTNLVRHVTISFMLVLGFTFLTALGAQIRIPLPFTPVPITMQTLVVLLSGAFLGAFRGSLSQALYLGWGISGLPLFAGATTGFAILAGPTGGYLIGFIMASWLMGRLIGMANTLKSQFLLFTAATGLILFMGWFQITLVFTGGDMMKGLTLGVIPFLPGTFLKVFLAMGIYNTYCLLTRNNRNG